MCEIKTVFYICASFCLMLFSCREQKKKHLSTEKIHEIRVGGETRRYYIETFSDLGVGIPGSDLNYDFLTDSSRFRMFVGKYDDTEESLVTKVSEDSIIIIKTSKKGIDPQLQSPRIIEERRLSLKEVINNGFE